MNTLSSARQRPLTGHPPNTLAPQNRPTRPDRVSPLDRLALHVGLALVRWSRRSAVAVRHERRARRVEQQLATNRRERAHERALRLIVPPH
ncbi:MAG: hypothetical protein RIC81_02240 [Microcella pacifica]|uniref:Uncharacterized protein n=1 Tax=Microcella pacifica TaxID=2591847 RepID=A0A9E5JNN1_9MICO|nr:hypothetical protein [Microcella pacifica]MBR21515.1 hypothetical protein [Leifsonia sp.]NHF62835.1 hypothetical protein [Microcella pacifica]